MDGKNMTDKKKTMPSQQVRKITLSGAFAALVFVATQIHIPSAIGYANLGDGVLLVGGFLLGPIGFFQAAIGAALADLYLGYPDYIPVTFIIKGLMGLIAGFLLKKKNTSVIWKIIVFIVCELIMVGGYFLFNIPRRGIVLAMGSMYSDLIQGLVGVIIAVLLCSILEKHRNRLMN